MGTSISLPLVKFTYVDEFYPTTARGLDPAMVQVGAKQGKNIHLLFQLDYSGFSKSRVAGITYAGLNDVMEDVLFDAGATDKIAKAYVLTQTFNANTVTWNTKPTRTTADSSDIPMEAEDQGIIIGGENPTNFRFTPVHDFKEVLTAHMLNGVTNHGIMVEFPEVTGAGFVKQWDFNKGAPWEVTMYVEYNRHPEIPGYLDPQGSLTAPGKVITLTPTLTWDYLDYDGDLQGAYQVIIYDANTNAVVHDTGKVNSGANSFVVPAGVLTWNKVYYWKVKNWDNDTGAQGVSDWSLNAHFMPNRVPSAAITSPTGTSGAPTILSGSNTPTITWDFTDADGDPQNSYQVQVFDGTTLVHDSGTVISPAQSYTVPAAANLVYDKTYNVQVRVKDSGSYNFGSYSTKTYFHLNRAPSAQGTNPTGSATIPQILTDQLTPTLTWTFTDQDSTDSQGGYQVQILLNGSALVHDSGQVTSSTKSYLVPGSVLENGNKYGWKVKVRDQHGLWGDWSPTEYFYNNQTPGKPVFNQIGTQISPFQVMDDLTPTLSWTYEDTDDDYQKAYQFKLYNEAGTLLHDSGVITNGTSQYTIPLIYKLTYGLKYQYEVKVQDKESIWSIYSDRQWMQPIVAAPGGLTITVDNLRAQFVLDWSDSVAEGLQGYNVYRKTEPGGSFSKINNTLVTVSNYTDSSIVSGTTYSYAIEAFVSDTQKSALSATVSAAASFSAWFIGAYKFDGALKFSESKTRNRTVKNTLTRRIIQDKGFNPEDMELELLLVDDDYSTARQKRDSIMEELNKTAIVALKDPFGGQWNICPGDISFDQLQGIGKAGWTMKIIFTEV